MKRWDAALWVVGIGLSLACSGGGSSNSNGASGGNSGTAGDGATAAGGRATSVSSSAVGGAQSNRDSSGGDVSSTGGDGSSAGGDGSSAGGSGSGGVGGDETSSVGGGAGVGSGGAGSGTGGASAGGTGGVTSCDCVPVAPDDWNGPVRATGSASDCPSALPDVAFEGGRDLVAPAAECTCTCAGQTPDVSCSGATKYSDAGGCSLGSGSTNPPPDSCHETGDHFWYQGIADVDCGMPAFDENVDPAFYENPVLACSGPDAGGCGITQECVPAAPGSDFEDICIYREGDHECPDSYPNGIAITQEILDTRQCTGCYCQVQGSIRCVPRFEEHLDTTCSDFDQTINPGVGGASFCPSDPVLSVKYVGSFADGSVTCETIGDSTPTGSATGQTPLTVCCRD